MFIVVKVIMSLLGLSCQVTTLVARDIRDVRDLSCEGVGHHIT
jgi:hypothetical protein